MRGVIAARRIASRHFTRIVRLAVLVLAVSFIDERAVAGENVVTPAMTGHWEGNARIIVNWCQQKTLPVAVDIRADGTVTGKVGDAALTNALFKANRGWLGRKLNLKTDYIITGKLSGQIIAAEKIARSGVKIPLNFSGGVFTGGVHTSGSKFGGKERMILSASSLSLKRN